MPVSNVAIEALILTLMVPLEAARIFFGESALRAHSIRLRFLSASCLSLLPHSLPTPSVFFFHHAVHTAAPVGSCGDYSHGDVVAVQDSRAI